MSRTPRRGRSGGRPASSSSTSQPFLLIGGTGLVVLILVFVLASSGSSKPADAGTSGAAGPAALKTPPKPPPAFQPLPAAKTGKTPTVPAPALTADTMGKLNDAYQQAKELYNQSVTARSKGDTAGARSFAGQAIRALDEWKRLVEANLDWQEQAQLEDWSQPAEYVQLELLYTKYSELTNMVRKAAG